MGDKLVRFVAEAIHPNSQRRSGLFQLIYELEDSGELTKGEAEVLEEIRAWFNRNLEKPDRFARSLRSHPHAKAVSWFKPSARAHIAKMRELAALFESHGYAVRQVLTTRPGYVVYEDEVQVTAVPFREGGEE